MRISTPCYPVIRMNYTTKEYTILGVCDSIENAVSMIDAEATLHLVEKAKGKGADYRVYLADNTGLEIYGECSYVYSPQCAAAQTA